MKNVYLIHFDNILVGVVEAVDGVSTDTVMKNFLGGSGIVWEECTQSRYRIDFSPVIAWASLAKMWDPIDTSVEQ
jgi:hypothetical protein